MEMREQRVLIDGAEDLDRVRETDECGEREDAEAVLERACRRRVRHVPLLRVRVLASSRVQGDDLDVVRQRASGHRQFGHGRQLFHAELV